MTERTPAMWTNKWLRSLSDEEAMRKLRQFEALPYELSRMQLSRRRRLRAEVQTREYLKGNAQ